MRALLAILLVVSHQAQAAYYSGATLAGMLSARVTSDEDYLGVQALGYIAGVHDALWVDKIVCTPAAVTLAQLGAVVAKHLREHPENLHAPANLLVEIALRKAYPCK